MHLKLFLCLVLMSDSAVSLARDLSTRDFMKLFNLLPRRNILEKDDDIIEMPKSVEDLPRAEPIKPGHTLIQPSLGMLESAVKYPQKDVSGTAVYGNLKNLGLTYGNTNQRLSYGSFRKSNLVATLLKAIENIQKQSRNKRNPYAIIIEINSGEYTKENKLQFAGEKRYILEKDDDIVETPKSLEDLPRDEPYKNRQTLIQPLLGKLKSATKYPQKDVSGTGVYENMKNLGLTFENTNQRLSYGSFRKSKDLLTALLQAIGKIQKQSNKRNPYVIVIEIDPTDVNQEKKYHFIDEKKPEIENDASEILDDFDSDEKGIVTRRKSNKRKNSKYRNRDSTASSSSEASSSSSDGSSDYESNPGNPFTVHKDKYKQNWLWNHFMDGDHMNVNPYAPQFSNGGPSGASLFFGRKWWYFNQDDYKPLQ